jgi:pseudaminic acid synthase
MVIDDVVIAGRPVGPGHVPFVIAEMSGNHNQSLDRALVIVDAVADSGAHALKIQTYTADTLTLEVDAADFHIRDEGSLWKGESLHALYEKAHTPWEWHAPIFERARERELIAFSTPFDESAVDFLEDLDCPCYKIASFENVHLPLIRKAASTGKPIIMSTGMATAAELDEAVTAAREAGCRDLVLLRCTSTYPAIPDDTDLRTLPHLRELFGCQVGLSDHTMGTAVAVAAIALGAVAVEKHLTLSRAGGGVDSAFSLEPDEFASLVRHTETAWRALGEVRYGPTERERGSLQFRRSLYVSRDLVAGEILTAENVAVVRPGFGLPPKFIDMVMGRVVRRPVTRGTALTWDLLE